MCVCSSVVERCPDKTEVLGPIPSTRTQCISFLFLDSHCPFIYENIWFNSKYVMHIGQCMSLVFVYEDIMEIEELEKKRDEAMTGFFWLGLQIAVIFAIPAITAAIVSKKIALQTGFKGATTIGLGISFIISWIIVIYIYRKKAKKMKEIEDKIRTLRKQEIKK